jgi:hypothetical protein
MPTLSQNDPEPDTGRSGPPARLIAVIVLVVCILLALHLSGVVGPGS